MPGNLAQRLAGTLMIPIILLPVAALFQALGFVFAEPVLVEAGRAILVHYLPLVFALGVAIGFAGGEAMALLSAAVGYAVMVRVAALVVGDATIAVPGLPDPVPLGGPYLNVGALGGLISGAVSTWLWHRCRRARLPEVLSLFSGPRFVPSIAALAGLPLGLLMGAVWPAVMAAIVAVGTWAAAAGAAGAFVYGAVLRVLVPTGLHHLLNNLVEYQLGAYADPVSGVVVTGEIQRFFHGDPSAGLLMSGFFILMMFCVPAIALALTHAARPEHRRRVAGLMTAGALAAAITGITEPVEFAFAFTAPALWAFHALAQGAVSAAAYALGIRDWGYALPLYILNWGASTRAWLILPLGLGFGVLYYWVFRAAIRRFRWPVLGQEAAGAVPDADVPVAGAVVAPVAGVAAGTSPTPAAGLAAAGPVLAALGGAGNIISLSACMSRLRLVVTDPTRIDEAALQRLGAAGVVRLGAGAIQVVFGPRSQHLCDAMGQLLGVGERSAPPVPTEGAAPPSSTPDAATPAPANGTPAPGADAATAPMVVDLVAPLSGDVLSLSDVSDPVFATGLAGDGLVLRPRTQRLVAPCAGRVIHVFPGGHAVGLSGPGGIEILLHIGIDTVKLKGKGFTPLVQEGDLVARGQELVRFDLQAIADAGYSPLTPLLITNLEQIHHLEFVAPARVVSGETAVLRVVLRPPHPVAEP